MTSLRLTVRKDGTDYVYQDDEIVLTSPTLSKRASGLDIEVGDVSLDVAAPFLGAERPDDLPIGATYRAKLELLDSGSPVRTLIDGSVRIQDIEYRDRDQVWSLVVATNAARDFWETLSDTFFETLFRRYRGDPTQTFVEAAPYLEAELVKCYFDFSSADQAAGTPRFETGSKRMFRPVPLMRFAFNELGWAFDLPATLWTYEVEGTLSTFTDVTITRPADDIYVTLLDGTVGTVVEQLTELAGWRMDIEYQDYPSLDLDVTARTTEAATAQPSLSLTDFAPPSWRLSAEDVDSNFAVRQANEPAEQSPDPADYSFSKNAGVDDPIPIFAVPPAYGTLAPREWLASPSRPDPVPASSGRIDPRDFQVDAAETDYRIPPIALDEVRVTDAPEGHTEDYNVGRILLPAEDTPGERQFEGDYIVQVDGTKAVHHVYTDIESLETGATKPYSTAWARSAYQDQPQRRAPSRRLDAPAIQGMSGTPVPIADTTAPIEAAGVGDWVGIERRLDLNELVQNVELRAVETSSDLAAVPELPADVDWRVLGLQAVYKTIDRGDGLEDWLFITWEPTESQHLLDYRYRVQYEDNRTSNGWQDIANGQALIYHFGTAAAQQVEPAGSGGVDTNAFDVRVRPEAPDLTQGAWVEANAIDVN